MKKKLIVSAITMATMTVAHGQTFLANSPVNDIHISDNAFTNPAFVGTTEDQLTLTDQNGGQLGWITTQFGQKIGIHLGRDVDAVSNDHPDTYSGTVDTSSLDNFANLDEALDLFWGANLGFGALGVNATVAAQSDKELVQSNRTSVHNGSVNFLFTSDSNATFDDNTDLFALDVSDNESKESGRYYGLTAGVALTDLPATINMSIAMPSASSSYALAWTDTQDVGASGGAAATARNIQSQSDITSSDMSGLETALSGTFNLTSALQLNATLAFGSQTIASTNKTVTKDNDDSDLNTAGVDTDSTDTFEDSSEYKEGLFATMLGARYTRQAGAVEIVVQSQLVMSAQTTTTSYTIDEDTLVDAVTPASSTTGRTGTNSESEEKEFSLYMPIRVSAQWVASDKWTWRAGSNSNLFYFLNESATEITYKDDPDNTTGFVKDKENQTVDSVFSVLPAFVAGIDLGFSYSPLKNVTFDAKFTKAFVEDGLLSDGPVDSGSIAATFRY